MVAQYGLRSSKKGDKTMKPVRILKEYRFESPLYLLSVPKNSKLRTKWIFPETRKLSGNNCWLFCINKISSNRNI